MDRTQAQDLLLDELNAPLDPAERREVRHHLDDCEPCRAFAALQRQLDAELRDGVAVCRCPTAPVGGAVRETT